MQVKDQFGVPVPAGILINEDFGAKNEDYLPNPPGSNWPLATPFACWTTDAAGQFTDEYGARTDVKTPTSVIPTDEPAASTKVDHYAQFYRAGSHTTGAGTLIRQHVYQRYRGRGMQE